MSHVCKYIEGECDDCIREAHYDAVRMVLSARGRWLVVYEGGGADRQHSLARARRYARYAESAGVRARVIRYCRDRVRFEDREGHVPGLEVTDARWLP